jgi:hypothetical protein
MPRRGEERNGGKGQLEKAAYYIHRPSRWRDRYSACSFIQGGFAREVSALDSIVLSRFGSWNVETLGKKKSALLHTPLRISAH